MSKKNIKKLLKAMAGKKKKPVKKTSCIVALEGKKNFRRGGRV